MPVPLDRQVTSLGLSKRLAEAGLPTDTLWCWAWRGLGHTALVLRTENEIGFPAYTTDELLEWLRTANGDVLNRPSVEAMDNCWEARLNDPTLSPQYAQTPVEALGELALKVKEGR